MTHWDDFDETYACSTKFCKEVAVKSFITDWTNYLDADMTDGWADVVYF